MPARGRHFLFGMASSCACRWRFQIISNHRLFILFMFVRLPIKVLIFLMFFLFYIRSKKMFSLEKQSLQMWQQTVTANLQIKSIPSAQLRGRNHSKRSNEKILSKLLEVTFVKASQPLGLVKGSKSLNKVHSVSYLRLQSYVYTLPLLLRSFFLWGPLRKNQQLCVPWQSFAFPGKVHYTNKVLIIIHVLYKRLSKHWRTLSNQEQKVKTTDKKWP